MSGIPVSVAERLAELKRSNRHSLQVKLINGGYYVYERYTGYDIASGRRKSYTIYVGKIERDGRFIKPHRKSRNMIGVRNVEGYVRARRSEAIAEITEAEERESIGIIEALSTDARMPLQRMADRTGLTEQVVRHRISQLESRFGIRYTIDISPLRFGLSRFMVTVRFIGSRPDRDTIGSLLEAEPNVQFAAFTKGSYDLVIYVIFYNIAELEGWLWRFKSGPDLAGYDSIWSVTYALGGNMILRDKFFTDILNGRVWRRSREHSRKRADQIFEREYAVLRALNANGKARFKEIDREYGLGKGVANRTFAELVERGVIERVTISMDRPPLRYMALISVSQVNVERYNRGRRELSMYVIDDGGMWTNRFISIGDIGSPYGILIVAPICEGQRLEEIEDSIRSILDNDTVSSAVITDVIVGSMIINRVDIRELFDYKRLAEDYGMSDADIMRDLKSRRSRLPNRP